MRPRIEQRRVRSGVADRRQVRRRELVVAERRSRRPSSRYCTRSASPPRRRPGRPSQTAQSAPAEIHLSPHRAHSAALVLLRSHDHDAQHSRNARLSAMLTVLHADPSTFNDRPATRVARAKPGSAPNGTPVQPRPARPIEYSNVDHYLRLPSDLTVRSCEELQSLGGYCMLGTGQPAIAGGVCLNLFGRFAP